MTSAPSSIAKIAFAALCCAGLGGCVVAAIGAGAAGGGYVLGQERGAGGTFSDTGIKSELEADYVGTNSSIEKYVDINVFEGRVLLTGNVPNPDLRDQAVQIAWKVGGVKEVINEVQVAPTSTFGIDAKDNWIQTRLRTALTLDSDIRSLNFSIETVNGVVYVIGIARSQAELDAVLNHARNTPDVRKVVNYVRIRSGTGEPAQTEDQAAVPITNGNQGAYAPAPGYQPAPPGQSPQYQSPQYQAPQYQAQPQQSYQPPPATSAPIQVEPLK